MKLKFVKACEQLDFTGSYIKNKLFEVTKKFKKVSISTKLQI